MKRSIFVILWILTWSFAVWASPIRGKGYSPKVGTNLSLGRMLATWDAISDALVKAQGTLDGSLSMEDQLIKSHRITLQHDLQKIQLIKRKCEIHKNEVQCEAWIDIQAVKGTRGPNRLELNECLPNKLGLQFCYTKDKIQQQRSSSGITTELVLLLQVRWGLVEGQHILFSELMMVRGLGTTKDGSVSSGVQQARARFLKESEKWRRVYSSFMELRAVEIPGDFEKKLEVYLQMMGSHSFHIRGKRFLLVPVFIQNS